MAKKITRVEVKVLFDIWDEELDIDDVAEMIEYAVGKAGYSVWAMEAEAVEDLWYDDVEDKFYSEEELGQFWDMSLEQMVGDYMVGIQYEDMSPKEYVEESENQFGYFNPATVREFYKVMERAKKKGEL